MLAHTPVGGGSGGVSACGYLNGHTSSVTLQATPSQHEKPDAKILLAEVVSVVRLPRNGCYNTVCHPFCSPGINAGHFMFPRFVVSLWGISHVLKFHTWHLEASESS